MAIRSEARKKIFLGRIIVFSKAAVAVAETRIKGTQKQLRSNAVSKRGSANLFDEAVVSYPGLHADVLHANRPGLNQGSG